MNDIIVVATRTPERPERPLHVPAHGRRRRVADSRDHAGRSLARSDGSGRCLSTPIAGKIYLAVQAFRAQEPEPTKAADLYTNEASLKKLRAEEERQKLNRPRTPRVLQMGFIGVWNITDDGNVPPRAIIRGTETRAGGFAGVAFNPARGEVYGVSGELNGFTSYLVPQFFQKRSVVPSGQ